jgi:hypothetical protein
LSRGRRVREEWSILRRIVIASLVAVASLAGPAKATAAPSWALVGGQQWAAVNVCNSSAHAFGVRASMPGDVLGRPMFTRFSTQWYSPAQATWVGLPGTRSPWLDAGPGRWLDRETGWTMTFAAAPAGSTFLLRGVVEMQWRRARGGVARGRTLVTPQTCALR